MASTLTRRPLPALVSLVALLLLTGLVWWRVLHRGGASAASTACPSPTVTVSETLPAQQQVTVLVLNATNRVGIAGKARTSLTDDGFKSPRPAGNDRPHVHVRGVAEIRYAPALAKQAKLLAYYFPGARMVPKTAKYSSVVVSLGDRYKRVASPQAVAAALAKNHVALQGTGPTPSASPTC